MKIFSSIAVIELGNVISVKLIQDLKAPSLIDVTEFGMTIDVNPELQKALFPIKVTEDGILSEVKFEQPSNALMPIEVNDVDRVIELRPEQLKNVLV